MESLGQKVLNVQKDKPLAGLQYVLEIREDNETEFSNCSFICIMCNKKMSSATLIAHLRSVPHKLKYVEGHCPDLHKEYGSIQLKSWTPTLLKEFFKLLNEFMELDVPHRLAVSTNANMNDTVTSIKEELAETIIKIAKAAEKPVKKEESSIDNKELKDKKIVKLDGENKENSKDKTKDDRKKDKDRYKDEEDSPIKDRNGEKEDSKDKYKDRNRDKYDAKDRSKDKDDAKDRGRDKDDAKDRGRDKEDAKDRYRDRNGKDKTKDDDQISSRRSSNSKPPRERLQGMVCLLTQRGGYIEQDQPDAPIYFQQRDFIGEYKYPKVGAFVEFSLTDRKDQDGNQIADYVKEIPEKFFKTPRVMPEKYEGTIIQLVKRANSTQKTYHGLIEAKGDKDKHFKYSWLSLVDLHDPPSITDIVEFQLNDRDWAYNVEISVYKGRIKQIRGHIGFIDFRRKGLVTIAFQFREVVNANPYKLQIGDLVEFEVGYSGSKLNAKHVKLLDLESVHGNSFDSRASRSPRHDRSPRRRSPRNDRSPRRSPRRDRSPVRDSRDRLREKDRDRRLSRDRSPLRDRSPRNGRPDMLSTKSHSDHIQLAEHPFSMKPANFESTIDSRSKSPIERNSKKRKSPIVEASAEKRPRADPEKIKQFEAAFEKVKARHLEYQKKFDDQPETHPSYAAEWKSFWEKKYFELGQQGVDPSKYDFKKEWVSVWFKRMDEMAAESIESKKKLLLTKYNLVESDLASPVKDTKTDRLFERSPSPWEKEDTTIFTKNPSPPCQTPSSMMDVLCSYPEFSSCSKKPMEFSVIGTLKAVKELEAQLGSFESAVNILLENALNIVAKGKPAIELFHVPDNLVLLRLVKEKLSSQLSSKILNILAKKKTEECIELITWLQNEVGFKEKSPEPAKKPFLGLDLNQIALDTRGMDSNQVATHIAMCLLKIEKANATEDELHEILEAVLKRNTLIGNQTFNKSEQMVKKSNTDNPVLKKEYEPDVEVIKVSNPSPPKQPVSHPKQTFIEPEPQGRKSTSDISYPIAPAKKEEPKRSTNMTSSESFTVEHVMRLAARAKDLNIELANKESKDLILPTKPSSSTAYKKESNPKHSNSYNSDRFSELKTKSGPKQETMSKKEPIDLKPIAEPSSIKEKSPTMHSTGSTSNSPTIKPAVGLSLLQDAYNIPSDEEKEENLEELSLDEIHNLLLNYSSLTPEKQKALNIFLKKMEATDIQKVTKLRAAVRQSMKKRAAQKASLKNKPTASHSPVNTSKSSTPDIKSDEKPMINTKPDSSYVPSKPIEAQDFDMRMHRETPLNNPNSEMPNHNSGPVRPVRGPSFESSSDSTQFQNHPFELQKDHHIDRPDLQRDHYRPRYPDQRDYPAESHLYPNRWDDRYQQNPADGFNRRPSYNAYDPRGLPEPSAYGRDDNIHQPRNLDPFGHGDSNGPQYRNPHAYDQAPEPPTDKVPVKISGGTFYHSNKW